jgi:outer membrane protein assembly factor BamB
LGTEAGEVFAVNWREAKVLWTFSDHRSSQAIRSCPAVNADTVVIGSRSKKVYAIDARTGEQKWVFPTKNRVDSSPVIVGQRVLIGSGDGRLYSINLEDGKKTWEYETGSGFVGSPAVAAGRLVIANEDGVVYCFGQKLGS